MKENTRKSFRDLLKSHLWLQVLIALLVGLAIGVLIGPDFGLVEPETRLNLATWLALPGKIFIGLIQMIVIPLILSSIILGVSSTNDLETLKSMGLRLVIFFIGTTTVSVAIGLGLGQLIRPGEMIDPELLKGMKEEGVAKTEVLATNSNIPNAIADLIPTNPFASMTNSEMLPVVIFAIIIGLAFIVLPKRSSEKLIPLLEAIQEVCMVVVNAAMRLAPLAVLGLMAQAAATVGFEVLTGVLAYVLTVIAGLICMLVFYGLFVQLVVGMSAIKFFKGIYELQLLAFSTSSSAAVMPISIQTAETKFNVKPSVSGFIIPLGATINMDGTALYQGVATVFIAQAFGIDLSFSSMLLIVVTSVAASIGTPGTPGLGIVILATVLSSAGVPTSGIGLILGVDRIFDMCRTAVNVTGDQVATLYLDRHTKKIS